MQRCIITFLFVFSCLTMLAQSKDNTGSQEPKSEFQLNVNGKIYRVKENEELKLDGTLIAPSISIKLSERKKFTSTAVSFEYPRHLTFEYEQDTGYKSWTFSGNNIIVIFFEFGATVSIDDLVEEMVNKFGKQNCSISTFRKALGNKMCDGRKLKVTLAEQTLQLDFYELASKDGGTRLIAFQDMLQDDGTSTAEYKAGFNTINSSISF